MSQRVILHSLPPTGGRGKERGREGGREGGREVRGETGRIRRAVFPPASTLQGGPPCLISFDMG